MATYKEIFGTNIQVVSSDPANPNVGQLWYNTTSQELKGLKQVIGNSWATANPLNTARFYLAGAGTQTAALAFGGVQPTTSPAPTATEEWYGDGIITETID